MAFLEYGEAVVDGVGSCEACAFKTDSGKEGVGLDDFLDCRGAYAGFKSDFGFYTFFQQSFASAIAASVVFPPAQEVAPLLWQALASK